MSAARSLAGRAAAVATAAAAAWLLAPDLAAQGCAMCRTAVEGQDDALARALSSSTLFLLAMPFAVVISLGGWIFFSLRRGEGLDGELSDTEHAPGPDASDRGD
jgi:hypothetical protein